jgi:hypothetical protein
MDKGRREIIYIYIYYLTLHDIDSNHVFSSDSTVSNAIINMKYRGFGFLNLSFY